MASNDLASIIEEIGRNFGKDIDKEPDPNQEQDGELDESDLTGMNDEEILEESKKISVFCRNCLSPYHGEQKDGSIILKCEKCYHRDVISETDLQETTAEHTDSLAKGGNIILNRFSKVILERNELLNIDVDDPGYMEDEFKRISEALPHITGIMKQTFSDMHKVTDDHRKVHNSEMVRMLTMQGQGEEYEAEDGTKAMKFSVPIHVSEENDDLVILPEQFKLPEDAVKNFKKIGRKGLQKVDKYVLNFGLDTNQIENMPMFQSRLLCYCKYANQSKSGDKGQENGSFDTVFKSKPTNTDTEQTTEKVHENRSLNENNQKLQDSNNTLSTDDIGQAMSDVGGNKTSSQNNQSEAIHETSEITDISDKATKPNKTDFSSSSKEDMTQTQNVEYESSGKVVSESSEQIEEIGCRPKVKSDDQEDTPSEEPDGNKSNSKHGKSFLPALLEFSNILYSTEEQKLVASLIPDDLVICDDIEPFTHVEANEAFNEVTSSMISRATVAKEQRMVNTMEMIKRVARSMSEEVDRVQDEMLKELQIAYKSKRIKADKQKKRLEETQNTLEHYRDLVAHYQQTGQVDKLMEVLDILRDYNSEQN